MTPSQLEHLRLIDAHLDKLLDIAAKRTPGEWKWHWRNADEAAPGSIFAMPREGYAYAVARCPRYGKDHFSDDATFIASCAGNAEAGWRATKAAINWLIFMHDHGEGWRNVGLVDDILAAYPLELITP